MELMEVLWERLFRTTQPKERFAPLAVLEDLYAQGVVDTKKWSFDQWRLYLQTLPQEEGEKIIIHQNSLKEIQKFLVTGKLRRPFDPDKLKEGLRSEGWLDELYNKVLLYETSLTRAQWKTLCEKEVKKQFFKGDKIEVQTPFKEFLNELLEAHPSPRRKAELWYHQTPEPASATPGTSSATPAPIQDRYEEKPREFLEKKKIDKLYYHYEQQPQTDDAENLSFLEELSKLDEEEEEEP